MLGHILRSWMWPVGCGREHTHAEVVDEPDAPTLDRLPASPGDLVAAINSEIIPEEGFQTSSGISLSRGNTRRFTDCCDI